MGVLKTFYGLFLMAVMGMGCAKIGTLNLTEHNYGTFPTRIVWIQMAGLQDEHLALLRFLRPGTLEDSPLEKMVCLGKTWTYNLFQIRPSARDGLLSQITGKKNIKNTCEDYLLSPVWKYMAINGYQSGIFESGADEASGLDQVRKCPGGGGDFLKGTVLWEMRPTSPQAKDKRPFYFHIQDQGLFHPDQIYYDRSCQSEGCYTSLSRNIEYVFENFQKNKTQYFFLIRDFSYYKALQAKDMKKVKEVLLEMEKVYGYFLNHSQNDRSMLLLLTSTAPINMEFPEGGKDWATFEEKGEPVLYKKTSLLSPVFAKGARAENFCGIYEEAQILQRISRGPPKVGF